MKTIRKFAKSVRRALTKKRGPLPAWGWAVVAVVGVVVYRRRKAAMAAGSEGDKGGGTGAAYSPTTPPDLMYQPGGAVPVDSSGNYPSSGGDLSGLLALLAKLIDQRGKRKNHPRRDHHHGNHQTRGGRNAPGHGEYNPRGGQNPHKGHKHRPRGPATIQTQGRGHGKGHRDPKGRPHAHTGEGRNYFTPRQRKSVKRSLVGPQATATSRPSPSHAPHRDAPRPAPRPSAPPKRTVRSVKRGR